MNDELVIEARGLRRRFGKLTAVDGVDLEIRRGEVFGFLGPNGAGKSTLIRMLVGLLPASDGGARVLGRELPREAEKLRADVGYMTQRFSLYEDLSIEENLRFAAEIFGLSRSVSSRRVEEVLREFELGERREQRPATLSGGWKQRLALAVATIHEPRLLVLDEPTAGVDPDRRRAFWEKIFELASRDVTVLVSTHYMDEAVRCHRLCMMIRGRSVAVGSPEALAGALEGRVIEIETRRPESVISELRTLARVSSVTRLGDRVHVLLSREAGVAGEVAPELERHLRDTGHEHATAQAAQPNLEDVFVALNLGETLIEEAA